MQPFARVARARATASPLPTGKFSFYGGFCLNAGNDGVEVSMIGQRDGSR
jgi:hypothetical protein